MTNTSSCPCGSLYVPAGSKHKNSGLSSRIIYSSITTSPPTANTLLLLNFDNSVSTDLSPNNFNVNFYGDATISTSQSKWGNSSLYLDGTSDYLIVDGSNNIASSLRTGNFTIEAWIRVDTISQDQCIISNWKGSVGGDFLLAIVNGELWCAVPSVDQVGTPLYISGGSIIPEQWHHVALTRSENTVRLFIDGEVVATDNAPYPTITNPDWPFVIGIYDWDGANYMPFYGHINDLRITNLALYTSKFDLPSAPFSPIIISNEYADLKLTHTTDSFLSNEQIFVTTTEEIQLNKKLNIQKIVLFCDNIYNPIINNSINIIIKDFNTKDVLFNKVFGAIDDSIPFSSNIIDNKKALVIENPCSIVDKNFYNNRFQIEIHSICDIYNEALCCNDNQISFTLDDKLTTLSLTCCSTTEPPNLGACCERGVTWNGSAGTWEQYSECLGIMSESECNPAQGIEAERIWIPLPSGSCDSCLNESFCDSFYLPQSFRITVRGYGDFDGQEKESIVYKNGNIYQTSGIFPCGAFFYLSMVCDPVDELFYYDGYLTCCNQGTKWVHDPTQTPLLSPNTITPQLIGYTNCSGCVDCVTTTTTTEPPELPCNNPNFGPITIQGYAFYRDRNKKVNIPGVGDINVGCAGGHVCNRTNFLPQLILSGLTIDGQPISMNNSPGGGDRSASFSFSLPDVTLLQNGASVRLQCLDNNCHNGVTAVVLTAVINGQTKLLFNSCLFPSQTVPLEFGCPPLPCNIESINWWVTHDGTLNGNPWVISNSGLSIRYNVEDSVNCGGQNPNIQSGTAIATIVTGSGDPVTLDINFDGIGELESTTYERLEIYLNDSQIGNATSAGGGLGCAMGPVLKTLVPSQQILAPNQTHMLLLNFTTNDPFYHVGAYYNVGLTFCSGIYIPPTTTTTSSTTTTTTSSTTTTTTTTTSSTTTTTPPPSEIFVTYFEPDVLTYNKTKDQINISNLSIDILLTNN